MGAQIRRDDLRRDAWDYFWKDKDGQVVLYQHPNKFILGWLLLTLGSLFTSGRAADILWHIALAVLAGWSVLEMVRGVNYFRRSLGLGVLIVVILAVLRAF